MVAVNSFMTTKKLALVFCAAMLLIDFGYPLKSKAVEQSSDFLAMSKGFEKTIDGKHVHLYKLENKNGVKAYITNFGGRLVSLFVPDKTGKMTDVVQGFNTVAGYQNSTEPYFGITIGLYGNRIAKGKFKLNGVQYSLFINNAPNTLHGGKKGFQYVVWNAHQ